MLIKNDVESTTIKSIAYEPAEKKLWLRFQSGGLYEYRGVEAAMVNGMIESDSKGKYFHQNIKHVIEGVKVEGE